MNRDFAEMLSALSGAGAEFLIVGVTFDEAWPRRLTAEVEGQPLPFIGRGELLANKRAIGRPKDLDDLSFLEGRAGEPR
jgi:hypothetical protein